MPKGISISDTISADYITLRFQNAPETERAFLDDYHQKFIQQIRICFLIALILVAVFGLLDWLIVPAVKEKVWAIRYGFICPILVLLMLSLFTPLARSIVQLTIVLGMVTTGLGIVLMIIAAPPPGDHLYYAGFLLLFIYLPTCRARFVYSAVAVWTLIGIYEIAAFFFTSTPLTLLISNNFFFISSALISMFTCYLLEYYARESYVHQVELEKERTKSEQLLLNILPSTVADRLKQKPSTLADGYPDASVLFADIVGFTRLAAARTPHEVVDMLNSIFTEFDHLTEKHGVEKIKTIGDAYMVAAGVPRVRDDHAEAVANMALDMLEIVKRFQFPGMDALSLRIGLDTGPVVAGVIGTKKYIYDIWGDTVNTASRMESYGIPGAIHVTRAMFDKLAYAYDLLERESLDVKGKGSMNTYLLIGKKGARFSVID